MKSVLTAAALLITACIASAAAQVPFPELESRSAALGALDHADAGFRLAGVIYFGCNRLATDGPLLVRRLSDRNPAVREVACGLR